MREGKGKGSEARHFVLDPKTGDYRPIAEVAPAMPAFVETMKSAIRADRHTGAMFNEPTIDSARFFVVAA